MTIEKSFSIGVFHQKTGFIYIIYSIYFIFSFYDKKDKKKYKELFIKNPYRESRKIGIYRSHKVRVCHYRISGTAQVSPCYQILYVEKVSGGSCAVAKLNKGFLGVVARRP